MNTSLSIETGVPVRAVISHGLKKWVSIAKGGNSAIATRYMLDSQFDCPNIESREVPVRKNAGNTGKKWGKYLPCISGSSSRLPVMELPVTSGYITSSDATSGDDPLQIQPGWCIYTTQLNATK